MLEDFLKPAGQSQNALARAIGVSPRRINETVLGKRAVTADTDLRLARYYKISEGIFLGLQADFELRTQRRALGNKLDFIRPRVAETALAPAFQQLVKELLPHLPATCFGSYAGVQ